MPASDPHAQRPSGERLRLRPGRGVRAGKIRRDRPAVAEGIASVHRRSEFARGAHRAAAHAFADHQCHAPCPYPEAFVPASVSTARLLSAPPPAPRRAPRRTRPPRLWQRVAMRLRALLRAALPVHDETPATPPSIWRIALRRLLARFRRLPRARQHLLVFALLLAGLFFEG